MGSAKGTKGRAGVSADIGSLIRVRLDGGNTQQKVDTIKRLVVLWNMHEGIPTGVLEAGAVRAFYDATQALVDALDAESVDFAAVLEASRVVSAKWAAITIELTPDGRRAECSCSEAA
jgi:hypothetical protein